MRIGKGELEVWQRAVVGRWRPQNVGVLLLALRVSWADDRRPFIADHGLIILLGGCGCGRTQGGCDGEQGSAVWRVHGVTFMERECRLMARVPRLRKRALGFRKHSKPDNRRTVAALYSSLGSSWRVWASSA